jgi:peptidoglycan hydrolase CwlO-like protein
MNKNILALALGAACIALLLATVASIAYYNPLVASKESQIASLNMQTVSMDSQISTLQNQKESQQTQISDLNAEIVRLNGVIEDLKSQASQRDAEMANKDRQIDGLNIQIRSLADEVNNLNSQVSSLGGQISHLRSAYIVTALGANEILNSTPHHLYISGSVINTGGGTAYNAGLHVVAYTVAGELAINMTVPFFGTFGSGPGDSSSIQLSSLGTTEEFAVMVNIYHEGVLGAWDITPVWTNPS